MNLSGCHELAFVRCDSLIFCFFLTSNKYQKNCSLTKSFTKIFGLTVHTMDKGREREKNGDCPATKSLKPREAASGQGCRAAPLEPPLSPYYLKHRKSVNRNAPRANTWHSWLHHNLSNVPAAKTLPDQKFFPMIIITIKSSSMRIQWANNHEGTNKTFQTLQGVNLYNGHLLGG